MTSRERMMIALENGRPDRLPCQVHGWMSFYLKYYLGDIDWWQANEKFGMDYAIYQSPDYLYSERDLARWQTERVDLGIDLDGDHHWEETITTPKGSLHHAGEWNEMTPWETEPLIKTESDFEIWDEFVPVPVGVDFTQLRATRERLGDKGIIRSHPFGFGQGSPWQSFCVMVGTERAIVWVMEDPDFVHYALERMLDKTLRVTEMWKGTPADIVETGGGAGSSTVISPAVFKEFCLPYDRRQHEALHEADLKVVYHLCGGVMHMLDLVVANGTNGLETMTPASMGGDCDLREASRLVGDKLFFIGGFDQNAGFERGAPEVAREMVFDCFDATRDHGGYIVAPSDHFFHGDPACIQAFVNAARQCTY